MVQDDADTEISLLIRSLTKYNGMVGVNTVTI